MAGNNAAETLIIPAGQLAVAPVGTAAPADEVTALNAAFIDVGYTTEEGVTFRYSEDKTRHRAWQSGFPVRSSVNTRDASIVVQLEQWTKDAVKLAFGGGTFTTVTAGHFKYSPPGISDAIYQRSAVLTMVDGTKHSRLVIPTLELGGDVETQFQRTGMSVLPLTLDVMGADVGDAWYWLGDLPAWA
jgi:hypothetical protein